MTSSDGGNIVFNELRTLTDERVIAHLNSLLLNPPRPIKVGHPHVGFGKYLEGFLIIDHPQSDSGIAYCPDAHGPEYPWGLVDSQNEIKWAGISEYWFPRLLDVYFEFRFSIELPIWRVREWQSDYRGAWLSEELSWDEAWARATELRAIPQHFRCYPYHSIEY